MHVFRSGAERSPGDGRHPSAVLVDEVSAGGEHPAVVEGGEGVSRRSGRVLPVLLVGILQGRELVFAQDLVHHKLPAWDTHISGSNREKTNSDAR